MRAGSGPHKVRGARSLALAAAGGVACLAAACAWLPASGTRLAIAPLSGGQANAPDPQEARSPARKPLAAPERSRRLDPALAARRSDSGAAGALHAAGLYLSRARQVRVDEAPAADEPGSAAATVWHLTRQTALEWWRDDALRLGAALAYYTVFSIAPVLVISVALAGFFFGEEAARGHVVEQLRGLMGSEGAFLVQGAIEKASLRGDVGLGATALSVLTLLLGASGAFGQIQYALNRIWNVEGKTRCCSP